MRANLLVHGSVQWCNPQARWERIAERLAGANSILSGTIDPCKSEPNGLQFLYSFLPSCLRLSATNWWCRGPRASAADLPQLAGCRPSSKQNLDLIQLLQSATEIYSIDQRASNHNSGRYYYPPRVYLFHFHTRPSFTAISISI